MGAPTNIAGVPAQAGTQSGPACVVCDCTEANACVDDRGPCWWVQGTAKPLCSHCAQPQPDGGISEDEARGLLKRFSMAGIAARHCNAAVTELLEYCESEYFNELDIVERLAEALALSIELRRDSVETSDVTYLAALDALHASARKFIEAWAP